MSDATDDSTGAQDAKDAKGTDGDAGPPRAAYTGGTSEGAYPSEQPGEDLGVPRSTQAQADVIGSQRGMFGVQGSGDTSGYGGLVRSITMAAPSERPYGEGFDDVADALESALGAHDESFAGGVEKVVVDRGEMTLHVHRDHLVGLCRTLRDDPDLRFEMCSSVSGVHYPHDEGRELHSVVHLLSITHNRRLRVEVTCPDADPHLPSIVEIYPTADWHERETWDFFGIIYDGHPALTRIQMPDDWPGHPQRKDYPLGGIPVEYKGASIPPPDTRRAYT